MSCRTDQNGKSRDQQSSDSKFRLPGRPDGRPLWQKGKKRLFHQPVIDRKEQQTGRQTEKKQSPYGVREIPPGIQIDKKHEIRNHAAEYQGVNI